MQKYLYLQKHLEENGNDKDRVHPCEEEQTTIVILVITVMIVRRPMMMITMIIMVLTLMIILIPILVQLQVQECDRGCANHLSRVTRSRERFTVLRQMQRLDMRN